MLDGGVSQIFCTSTSAFRSAGRMAVRFVADNETWPAEVRNMFDVEESMTDQELFHVRCLGLSWMPCPVQAIVLRVEEAARAAGRDSI